MSEHESNFAGRSTSADRNDSANRRSMSTNGNTRTATVSTERQALARVVLIGSLLGLSWLTMQGVHELGHVLAAWMTGGTVTQVRLHPLSISSTDVRPNPRPLIVTWAGPLFGSVLPVCLWGFAHLAGWCGTYLLRFWTGLCLVANGAYLGAAAFLPVGDAQVLLQLGAPLWSLMLCGLLAISAGLALWHGQSQHFSGKTAANPRHAWGLFGVFVLSVILLMWSG